MNKQTPQPHLICYDIADPKRLARVHRRVSDQAISIQYSVYYLEASADEVEALLDDLRDIIAPKEDDIRVYPLPKTTEIVTIGRSGLGEGNLLIGADILPLARGLHPT